MYHSNKGMKILKFHGLFALIFLWGCQSFQKILDAEILSAEYSIVTHSEFERGYQVFLNTKPLKKSVKMKYILLNQKLLNVEELDKQASGNFLIDAYFPIQSKMIQNFVQPLTDKRKDGIIFEIDGEENYKEIKFKLK